MAYYKICPCCGAALDPGERCDCEETTKDKTRFYMHAELPCKMGASSKENCSNAYQYVPAG